MNKQEWYVDRIIWKAKQNKLFDKTCILFEDLENNKPEFDFSTTGHKGTPVIIFYNSPERWTLITSEEVLSYYDETLKKGNLDDIGKKISISRDNYLQSQYEVKTKSNMILLDNLNISIWVPEGEEMFGLMNLLMMFPLNPPND